LLLERNGEHHHLIFIAWFVFCHRVLWRIKPCRVALVVKLPHFFDSLYGLLYLRWGGDGEAVQTEKCSGVGKCSKNGTNPQRQVHPRRWQAIIFYQRT